MNLKYLIENGQKKLSTIMVDMVHMDIHGARILTILQFNSFLPSWNTIYLSISLHQHPKESKWTKFFFHKWIFGFIHA